MTWEVSLFKSHNCYKQAQTEKDVGEQDELPAHMKSDEAPLQLLPKATADQMECSMSFPNNTQF